MINLTNLNKQHNTITTEIQSILSEVEKDVSQIDTTAAAYHISVLAGQLKMHLLNEDKLLYPDLLSCNDDQIKELTNQYIIEMGNLAEVYTIFKNNYNTKNKINQNTTLFLQDTIKTMTVLKNRIEKEDKELYRLILERGL
ncbi:MAG: cation-binding protein [Lachnospiraceae bacterium]|jgi:hemerythrin-like domain-containing protein|nr:cation-binding protein [Lachnospiraceae bacterium]